MKKNITILGLILFSAATVANATTEGMYFGAQAGASKLNNSTRNITISGTTYTISPKNTGVGARFFAGYQLNEYLGGEMGYTYYTPSKYQITIANVCNPTIKEGTLDFMAKGMLPIWISGLSVYAKVGGAIARQTMSGSLADTSGTCTSSTKVTTNAAPAYGIGVSYDITQSWQADISFNQVLKTTNIPTATLIAVGVSYHIVDKRCGQFLC